ncbi:MAG: DPP IV N-terminal domain-containing protein [Gemmatimonadota bacterium]|nr:DPP IV N-terminal domain-containing protein [Gemmatimonadota bacterium]
MNYRSILIVCLATLGLAVAGWGQAGDRIAFVSDREGTPDIWTMNVDGSDAANLTKGRGVCASPAWSPDGMMIAYIDNGEIWLMNADGSNPQQVTDDSVHKAWVWWSEDGSEFYYAGLPTGDSNGFENFIVGLDGKDPISVDRHTIMSRPSLYRTPYRTPLSPDGDKEAVVVLDKVAQNGLAIRDINEEEHTFIPLTGILELYIDERIARIWHIYPTWSPDSMRIAFAARSSSEAPVEIWAIDIDGSSVVNLTNGLSGHSPAWRPATFAATSVETQTWGQIKSLPH